MNKKGKKPLVSIVMPLYNKRPYLSRAIESVRAQTCSEWELIIVDDGSTDGSTEEIPLNDDRIRLVRQDNAGPAAARNRGIGLTEGDLVTFIDADDYYYPDKLEAEVTLLLRKKLADWMMSPHERESGSLVTRKYIRDCDGKDISERPTVFDQAFRQLSVTSWGQIHGLCIRRSMLMDLGGFREEMRFLEVNEFLVRCALRYPDVVIYNAPLFRMMDVPGSASTITDNIREGIRLLGESFHQLARQFPDNAAKLALHSRGRLMSYVLMLLQSQENGGAREYLTRRYPYPRDLRWWKLWAGSVIPPWMFNTVYLWHCNRKS